MGGRLSMRMAGEFPDDVGAAASFHGANMASDGDDSPHLSAVNARGELYIGHADNDRSMPPEQMARLTQALAEAHVRHTAELYVGAAHGWTQADTPAFDEACASPLNSSNSSGVGNVRCTLMPYSAGCSTANRRNTLTPASIRSAAGSADVGWASIPSRSNSKPCAPSAATSASFDP
jgi:hypothetical protein